MAEAEEAKDAEDAAAGDGGAAALNIGDSAGLKDAVSKLKQKIEVIVMLLHPALSMEHMQPPAADDGHATNTYSRSAQHQQHCACSRPQHSRTTTASVNALLFVWTCTAFICASYDMLLDYCRTPRAATSMWSCPPASRSCSSGA